MTENFSAALRRFKAFVAVFYFTLERTVQAEDEQYFSTVESRFYEPPREAKIGSKNRRVREIGSKITVFD